MSPQHFQWRVDGKVGVVTLNRPEKKNPLTFESYAELRDFFRNPPKEAKSIVITGAGGNFCSGGDVHEIIGPLTKMDKPALLEFTRMTGDLVRAMRACPQPVIAAIDGTCAGAGAMIALASDFRYATPAARTAQARLAPMPSAAFSHTTTWQPSAERFFARSEECGRTTATTLGSCDFKWRADCTAIDTPCGRLCCSLSEPKRVADPAASSRPTMFKS